MRRTVCLPLAFAVFAASGVALAAAAIALPSHPTGLDRSEADEATVRRFYAAVNDALRAGSPPALDGVVAPEALRASERPDDALGTDLERTLGGLVTAFAGLQLWVEALVADDGQVVALVAVDGDRRDLASGLPLRGPSTTWRSVDRFRLDEGRIVAFDRWEQGSDAASAQPLFAIPLARLPAAPAAIEIARVTLPPGADISGLIGPGPELLLLEAGGLTVHLAGPARLGGVPPGTLVEGEVALRPGDRLAVPTGTPFDVSNGGQVPAVVLDISLRATAVRSPENEGVDAAALDPAALVPGAAVQRLAQSLDVALPAGPATVAAARLTLAPGAGIAPHAAAGAELLAVEAGTLGLTVSAGAGQLTRTTGAELLVASAAGLANAETPGKWDALVAGEGAMLPAGTGYAARNVGAGPVALLVVRVVPAEREGQ